MPTGSYSPSALFSTNYIPPEWRSDIHNKQYAADEGYVHTMYSTRSLFGSGGRGEGRSRRGLSRAELGRRYGLRVLHGRQVLPPVVWGDVQQPLHHLHNTTGDFENISFVLHTSFFKAMERQQQRVESLTAPRSVVHKYLHVIIK